MKHSQQPHIHDSDEKPSIGHQEEVGVTGHTLRFWMRGVGDVGKVRRGEVQIGYYDKKSHHNKQLFCPGEKLGQSQKASRSSPFALTFIQELKDSFTLCSGGAKGQRWGRK